MDDEYRAPEGSSQVFRLDTTKVAIPRILGHDYQMPAATRATRARSDVVNKACNNCRKRKIKCSGDRPSCTNCSRQNHQCHYDQERKDRLRIAQRKNQVLTQLLADIHGQVDDDDTRKRVEDALNSFEDDSFHLPASSRTNTAQSKRPRKTSFSLYTDDATSTTSQDGGEAFISASVGSNEDLDFIQEDLLQNDDTENSAGYLGRNSQIQWLRALEVKVEQPEDEPPAMPYGPPGESGEAFNKRADALHERQQIAEAKGIEQHSFTNYYFYLDRNNIEIDIGDPHIIPSADIATKLFDYYKQAVHTPFKILNDDFEIQMHKFYLQQNRLSVQVCSKWMAILNLVFAIGAHYSHLVAAEWEADDRDHLVYMWRAVHFLQLGSMKTLVSHPDQSLIQAMGLLSFYYLTIGHVSRAWYMIGIAIRHAQAAGLHLRSEDSNVDPKRRKTLAQIWWALYSFECVLTSITGRPRTIVAKDCTVPPPGAIGTDMQLSHENTKPNLSSVSPVMRRPSGSSLGEAHMDTGVDGFDIAYVRLDILMDKILSGLYSARKSSKSWKSAQGEINLLSEELEAWAAKSLTPGPSAATSSEHSLGREQLLLHLYYYSAKICITRPCLCRLDLRIKGQSEESAHFNQKMAENCIGAALGIASMLPSPPNPTWLYENGPWWCAVHIIMQGLTVFLLELSLGGIHLTVDKSYVVSSADKLIGWLQAMKVVDAVSESAYNVVAEVLSRQNEKDASAKRMPQPRPTRKESQQQHRQHYSPHGLTVRPYPQLQTQPQPQYAQSLTPDTAQPLSSDTLTDRWLNNNNNYPSSGGGSYFQPVSTGGGSFYHADVSGTDFVNDPGAAATFEFGQPQMDLFYGNPYQEWQWDPSAFDGQGQCQGQQSLGEQQQQQSQAPGQGFGGGGPAL